MGAIKSVCDCQRDTSVRKISGHKTLKKDQDHQNTKEIIAEKSQLTEEKIDKILDKKAKIKKKIEFSDFAIEGKLGEGGFGVVFLGQLKEKMKNDSKCQKYAIKKVSKQLLIKKKVYANAIDQKNILAMYECKFIVALIMAFQDPWFIFFVMEWASGGDTYSLIKKNSPKLAEFKLLGEKAVRFIAGCVILGLEYLHEHDYMYRDLKPENVLLFDNGYAKLTDFGLAKKSLEGEISKTVSGTPFYYAPQMVLKKGYNKQIDFWTLGVYLYELSVYEPPFVTEEISRARFESVCLQAQKNRNWKNSNLSPELKDLINGLLKFNEKTRLGAKGWSEVKEHAFFKNGEWSWQSLINGTMESPLKDLVHKFPGSIKPYKPQTVKPKEKNGQETKVQGWTYYKNDSL